MRLLLIRARENAEAIAFYGAEALELGGALTALSRVVRVTLTRLRVVAAYDLFALAYSYASIVGARQ